MKKLTGLFAACVLLFSGAAHSTLITYTAENTGGNTYEFNFTIENTGTDPLTLISIFFDAGLFENLAVVGAPDGWDPLVFQPDPSIPDAGFFDLFALFGGIGAGEIVSGFSMTADFLGDGPLGDLLFWIQDSTSFDVIERGLAENVTVSVPEPGTLPLLLLSLFILVLARRRAVSNDSLMVPANAITARAA